MSEPTIAVSPTGSRLAMSDPKPCVFCEIHERRAPAKILRDFHYALVIEPLNPVAVGHALVISLAHVADFAQDPVASAATMKAAATYAQEVGGPCNLITSKGREATQSVFHLHLHVVPRHKDDGLALPWYSGKGGHREH